MEHLNYGIKTIFPHATNISIDRNKRTISFDLVQRGKPHTIEITDALHSYMKILFHSTALSFSIQKNKAYIKTNNMYGTFIRVVISDVSFSEIIDESCNDHEQATGFGLADYARFKEEHPQNTK